MSEHGPYVIRHRPTRKFWCEPVDLGLGEWVLSKLEATEYARRADAEKAERAIKCGRHGHACNEVVPFDKADVPNHERANA